MEIIFETESFPVWASLLITLCCIIMIALIVTFFVLKKMKLESDLADDWWRIKYEDIIFPEVVAKSGHKSVLSLTVSETEGFVSGKTSSARVPSVVNSLMSAAGVIDSVLVGIYKGIKVAVKPLNIKKINLSRSLLFELKQVCKTHLSFISK